MFEDKKNDERSEIDAAWANETQRFETIFHHKDDPTTGPVTWDDVDEYPVDEGLINTQEDKEWDAAWDDFYLKADDDLDLDLSRDDLDYLDDLDDIEPKRTPGKESSPVSATAPKNAAKHGAHAAKSVSRLEKRRAQEEKILSELPEHMASSRRKRKTLLLVLALLIVVLGAVAIFATTMVATQGSQSAQEESEGSSNGGEVSEGGRNSRKTEVPKLTGLFGLSKDDAIKEIGHGATETASYEVDDKDNDVKKKVTIVLADEPSDSKSGTPTVYLGLDKDGKVVMAGYCAATASLGYGALSFADLVENEKIIEQTLAEAGISVKDGSVSLPSDPSKYQTYDSDGSTLVRETCDFDGEGTASDSSKHKWSGVLTYDYTAANTNGNLADTVRQVYIYVNK